MSCESVRQHLLDLDLDQDGRRRTADALRHIAECPECSKAFADFDAMRLAIALTQAELASVGPAETTLKYLGHVARPTGPLYRRVLALAAAVALATATFEFGRLAARRGSAGPLGPLAAIDGSDPVFSAGEIKDDLRTFHQVSQVFDGKAKWMLVSQKAQDVGVEQGDVGQAGKVLLLRLAVAVAGKNISSADVLVIPGQTADLSVPLEDGQALHYRIRTSTDEPAHLSLMAEMRGARGSELVAALSTDLFMQSGQKATAGELCSAGNRYVLKIAFARASLSPKDME